MYAAGEDYAPLSQVVQFERGETEKQIIIEIINDNVIEESESFELYLTISAGAYLSPYPRTHVYILNDDRNGKCPVTICNNYGFD